jgi:tRNA nucleotidyltransferase (CCA-adding enzyme)
MDNILIHPPPSQLLSLPSSDLDVTLSSISGFEFATAFTNYLSQLQPPIPTRSIGKVAANPDQSKHLETAATKILGLDLDFVALRSESYANGSRIPSEVVSGETA